MQYYLCAFGHVTRISKRTSTPEQAAQYCFGVVDRVTVLPIGGRSWRYFNNKTKGMFLNELKKKHFEATGNQI
jgi:hypothetical protein